MKNKILILASCMLLAACTTQPQAPTSTVQLIHASSNIDELLAYNAQLRKMSPTELGRELQRLNSYPAGPATTVRRAMALSLTRDGIDLAKAEAQLWNVMADRSVEAEKLKPLAQLLVGHYSDLRRVADSAEKSSVQLKEAQRKVDQLNDKLEALKNIERTLPAGGK
ncbi:MAG TPA: hypothetical protein VE092_09225 [Herbaspirillum sp.]|uniref:hypothetical protein n=1 Tax=Herbaspirillum sp. TaxID=1890675 RepID=UPI002D42CF77|nr:hypothetical protein [Herbaspirillum sp.]HZG20183.1 hypothetical protein [Herbaspirillum sp.]